MPVDRPLAEDLAANLVDLYTDAQTRLAIDVARRLDSGMALPIWAEDKLDGLNSVRRFAADLLQDLGSRMADEVAQATILAYVRGSTAALDDLGRANSRRFDARIVGAADPSPELLAMIESRAQGAAARLAEARRSLPGLDAINRLAYSLSSRLQGTHLRILRWDVDAYREVIARTAAPGVLLGLSTRRRAAQAAWGDLLDRGITGFVDRSGRGWNLASYVEMATRTTVAQAAVEGHLDRLNAAGLDLVIVSNAPQECVKCRPWEGKILARGGPAGSRTVQVEHATRDGEHVDVEVAGSVDDAVTAGLMHPNCRHSLSAYMPGVTRVPTNTEDPEGDAARQKLRALERKVRAEKLKAAAAIDPAARSDHERKARAAQAQIRDHVKATGLHRQPSREQIDFGNRRSAGPGTTPPATSPTPTPAPTPTAPTRRPAPPPAHPGAADVPDMLDGELFDLWMGADDNPGLQSLIGHELDRRDRRRTGQTGTDPLAADTRADTDPLTAETLADLDEALDQLDAERAAAKAKAARDRADQAAQAEREQAIDRLVARGWEYRDAYAEVHGLDAARLLREERAAAVDADRRAGETREQAVRRQYGEWVQLQHLRAEEATRGHMLNPTARARGVDPASLFSGPAHVARANASEDLLRWWAEHGRQTYTEFRADVLGRASDVQAAKNSRLQGNGQDFI